MKKIKYELGFDRKSQRLDMKYFIYPKYIKCSLSKRNYENFFFLLKDDYISAIVSWDGSYACAALYEDTSNRDVKVGVFKINFPNVRKRLRKRIFNILKADYRTKRGLLK